MDNTFEILKETKKPFIFISSQMSNMSHSPYGLLKSLGELYSKTLNGLVVKLWNTYGFEKDLKRSHVITDFIIKAIKNKKIDVLTNGSEKRQFLFADDCSECLSILAEKYNEIPREKNLHITSFKWNSVLEVANIVAKIHAGTKIETSNKKDSVQKNKINEPDPFILKFWTPNTSLQQGIEIVNKEMQKEL